MPDIPAEAILAATKAVAACNVSWKTAIDDPATVVRAAIEAAAPHLERPVYVLAVGHALDDTDAENIQHAVVKALRDRKEETTR